MKPEPFRLVASALSQKRGTYPDMKRHTEASMLRRGLYLSYMNYYATGEGVRSCLAIGGSKEKAETLIKEKLHTYFHALIATESIEASASQDVLKMIEWVPPKVRKALAEMPTGVAEYYSEFHYNLA